MKPALHKFDPASEFLIGEGCFIIELSNSPQDPGLSIARARIPPGVTTRLHRLRDTAERYVILEGTGIVEIEGLAPSPVQQGDVVIIPANVTQRMTNPGNSDLIFLAMCTPRFLGGAYEDMEPGPVQNP